MLLRNLTAGPGNGLCNGTQHIILKRYKNVIEVGVASGVNKGKCVLIPRITIAPSDRSTIHIEKMTVSNQAMHCYVN